MLFPRPSTLRSILRSLLRGKGMGSVSSPPATGYPENASLEAWLARAAPEPILEPELRICDAHHHLWDHRGVAWGSMWKQSVYLLPELLRDVTDGHNVVSTVYVQAFSFHRSFGPEEERPVGEVEFAQGVAAMADSGLYGQCRAHAAIVGFCDLKKPNADRVLGMMRQSRNFVGVATWRSPISRLG